jgi:hypothetical protein
MKMKYEIPIIYKSCKTYTIEADNLQDAITESLKMFLSEPDENYLDDSFEIDDVIEDYMENFDIEKSINEL